MQRSWGRKRIQGTHRVSTARGRGGEAWLAGPRPVGSLEAVLGQFPGYGEEGVWALLSHLSEALSCVFSGLGKFKVTPSGVGEVETISAGLAKANWEAGAHACPSRQQPRSPSALKAQVGPVPLLMGCVSNLLLAGRLAGCGMRGLLTPQLWSGLCRLRGNE